MAINVFLEHETDLGYFTKKILENPHPTLYIIMILKLKKSVSLQNFNIIDNTSMELFTDTQAR